MIFILGENRSAITFDVKEIGNDLVIFITGGDVHIGAVSLSILTKKHTEQNKKTFTTSLLSVPGHKEEELIYTLSRELSKVVNKSFLIVMGIHYDSLTVREINHIQEICMKGILKIALYYN